jgi:hypothetical protein
VIVLGAGAIGNPVSMYLAEKFQRVLCIDGFHSTGQGDNKRAVGGVRATFGNPGKIAVSMESIEVREFFNPGKIAVSMESIEVRGNLDHTNSSIKRILLNSNIT